MKLHTQSKDLLCLKFQDMAKSDRLVESRQKKLKNKLSKK